MSAAQHYSTPYSLYVVINAKPGRGGAFERLIRTHIDHMSREDCFLAFVLHRDPTNLERFMFFELWSDRDLYVATRSRDYFRQYIIARAELIIEPIERAEWDVLRVQHASYAVSQES